MRHYQKAFFLIAVGLLVVIIRFWSPAAPIPASDASSTPSSSTSLASAVTSTAAAVAPTGQGSAFNSADGIGGGSTSTAPYYGESNTAGSVFTRVATTAVPQFAQHATLVADLSTGVVLEQNNEFSRWPTASLTKLMTATVVLDHLSTSTEITITPQMLAVYPQENTLVVNGTYTVEDLLHVMLMPSSNVAAEAMADYYGRAAFLAAMNQRAQEWGMTNTYFDDPSGLSSANQSTAHDFLILAQHIYQNYPQVLALTNTPETTITNLANGKKYDVKSINDFAGDPDFVGGKTGYIPESEDNLLSIFNEDGHPVLIVVLGVSDRFGDTTELLNWFKTDYQ